MYSMSLRFNTTRVIFTMHSNMEYQLFLDHFDVFYTVAKKPVLGILLQLPA